MKKFSLYISIIIPLLMGVTSSCKKIIDLNLETAGPQLVIEGNVTNVREVQTVKISRTVPVDAQNVFPAVSGANVSMQDSDGNSFQFQEAEPGIYQLRAFAGKTGVTYTLLVEAEGKTYQASSTMPTLVTLDSLTASEQTFGSEVRKTIAVNFQDPAQIKNYYLFKMALNGVQVAQIFSDSDFFTDGRLVQRDLFLSGNDDLEIVTGDRVVVEMQCIDEKIYTYWRTLEQQYATGNPNDVTTPANPPNNWNNKALGYFSAHTTAIQNVSVM
jgi:hypothetical protein